jgi:hypothetical protein
MRRELYIAGEPDLVPELVRFITVENAYISHIKLLPF